MYYKSEGIILSQKNIGEADKLLTIYTRNLGKISCIAKSVRKPTSRKSGHIELGNWCKIFVAKGKNIDLLTEVEIKKNFGANNFSPAKANKIYHVLEIVNILTPANQNNPETFNLLLNFLQQINLNKDFKLVSSVFKIKLLSLLGFFSARSLKSSKVRELLKKFEKEDLNSLEKNIKLDDKSYLKLLSFLDNIIENIAERKLKTSKYLDG